MATTYIPFSPRTDVLKKLHTDLPAEAKTKQIPILGVGDSIALYGASSFDVGFFAQLTKALYAKYPVPGVTADIPFQYYAADFAVDTPYPFLYEPKRKGVPGKMTVGFGDGIGQQASYQSAGSGRWKEIDATTMGVWTKRKNATDVAEISVNGVLRKTVSAGPVGVWVEHRISQLPTDKTPLVNIDFITGTETYAGHAVYRGCETKGWQLWDGHHSGYGTNQFIDEGPNGSTFWMTQAEQLSTPPRVIWISLGTNDGGYSSQVFYDKRKALVSALRKRFPNAIIIDIMWQEPSSFPAGMWDGFIEQSHKIASEFKDYIVFDFSKFIPKQSKGTSANMHDGLHPNELGYAVMVEVFMNYWTGVYDLATAPGGSTGTGDVAGPTITDLFPPAGATVALGATQDFTFTITDPSGVGAMAVVDQNGRTLGASAPVQISGSKYGVTGIKQSALDAAGVTSWEVRARDASTNANLTVTGLRPITVAKTPVVTVPRPSVTPIGPSAGTVVRDVVPFSATITHDSGIGGASVMVFPGAKEYPLTKAASSNIWSANVLQADIDVPADPSKLRFVYLAYSNANTTISTTEIPLTLGAPTDSTAPTAEILSPVDGSIITERLLLSARSVDLESGVKSVGFCANLSEIPFAPLSLYPDGTWGSERPGDDLPSGTQTLRVQAIDVAGNIRYSEPIAVSKAAIATGEQLATVDAQSLLFFSDEVQAAFDQRVRQVAAELIGSGGGGTPLPIPAGRTVMIARGTDGRVYDTGQTDTNPDATTTLIARDADGRIYDTGDDGSGSTGAVAIKMSTLMARDTDGRLYDVRTN